MKKPSKPSGIVVSVCVVVVFAVAATMFFLPYMPQPIQDVLTPKPTPATDADGETVTTRPTMNEHYLYTEPSEWFAVGEDVNWNGRLLYRVENVSVSRDLPADIGELDMSKSVVPSFFQEIIDKDEDRLVLDLTVEVTCTALPKASPNGMLMDEGYQTIAPAGMMISYYDRENNEIQQGHSDYWIVASKDLSGNGVEGYAFYVLAEGETARFRLVRLISQHIWETQDVLFTMRLGYGAWQLQTLHYTEPHILLNEKA